MYRLMGVAVAYCVLAAHAQAAPIVDGALGVGEYGAPVQVNYNAAAPMGNFGSPTNENSNVAYNIYLTSDANFVYGLVQADPSRGGAINSLVFANLYFDTNPNSGSDLGFEVTNNNAFKPGVPGSYDLTGTSFTYATSANGVEFAIPVSFFRDDPLGIGFPTVPAGGGDIRLNLSQSFGYSVAGGQADYGDDRLGRVSIAALAPVPEPATLGTFALLAGVIGLRMRRRAA